jgi:hypothetical protein
MMIPSMESELDNCRKSRQKYYTHFEERFPSNSHASVTEMTSTKTLQKEFDPGEGIFSYPTINKFVLFIVILYSNVWIQ